MSQAIDQRLGYHTHASGRSQSTRISLLLEQVDFEDKIVFDLGCSGGGFVFSLAKYARYVTGVDADPAVISQNEIKLRSSEKSNIEFVHAKLSGHMPFLKANDVTLMMSVFHHMVNGSEAYDWNESSSLHDALAIVHEVRDKTDILIFETGLETEGFDWCSSLPYDRNSLVDWVTDNIFGADFEVTVYSNPTFGGLFGRLRLLLASKVLHGVRGGNLLRRLFGVDVRDLRPIFIGRRSI